jgi:hypothetical protein
VTIPPRARLVRVPLEGGPEAAEGALLVRDDEHPFALAGNWAGGGALVGSEPLVVASEEDDPFALLDVQPEVTDDGPPEMLGDGPPEAVGGGSGSGPADRGRSGSSRGAERSADAPGRVKATQGPATGRGRSAARQRATADTPGRAVRRRPETPPKGPAETPPGQAATPVKPSKPAKPAPAIVETPAPVKANGKQPPADTLP